ncbi:MAG TPA: phosphoenolpyruvate synthase [Patescibacteria group bacterium]|nr:phosphoenolpyruvate synthase [Patescibacteria group bacterium]
MSFIRFFNDIQLKDVPLVGGKNAALGEMTRTIGQLQHIDIPYGFAVTTEAYWYFIKHNKLSELIDRLTTDILHNQSVQCISDKGSEIRLAIQKAELPHDLSDEIISAYDCLKKYYTVTTCAVAVRSSAIMEDAPEASCAGQQETFLNVQDELSLLNAYQNCLASLFTDRAIMYRLQQKYTKDVALSVGVQKMVRSDLATAGVAFSLDTETGYKDVVSIDAGYGLGEYVVKATITPDHYKVHKILLSKGSYAIIEKKRGKKHKKLICLEEGNTNEQEVSLADQKRYALSDEQIEAIAQLTISIENYFSLLHNTYSPMDIEWAIDGLENKIYIVQARPETVFRNKKSDCTYLQYTIDSTQAPTEIIQGIGIGAKIVSGKVRCIMNLTDANSIQEGEILVTYMTDPDWVLVMKKAAGIITDEGGRTCHAAIVSRELGIPAIVGTQKATALLKTGDVVTLDCTQMANAKVYAGKIPFSVRTFVLQKPTKLPCQLLLNITDPGSALAHALLPSDGVGLARIEFIIASTIGVHPLALVYLEKINDQTLKDQIKERYIDYINGIEYFIDTLSRNIACIGAAFYPRKVIVRFSDFKTNEYAQLLGGSLFEKAEQNPMLGLRGACRYYSNHYKDAFVLECKALAKVRSIYGLHNVHVMIPFVRTPGELKKVITIMKEYGLEKDVNALEIYLMCELPANVLLLEQYTPFINGISIGSNDLTQLVLGIDRDSSYLSQLFNEEDAAVQLIIKQAIEKAHAQNITAGICGQAPSDFSEFMRFLLENKIDSTSLNADVLLPFLKNFND